MARLSGTTSSPGARLPIRVETLSGVLVALTTSNHDGSWSVEVEPGDYVIVERYGGSYRMSTSDRAQDMGTGEYPPGSPGASRRARAQRGEWP